MSRAASTFELCVEFSGLFMFWRDKKEAATRVVALAPDARENASPHLRFSARPGAPDIDHIDGGKLHLDGTRAHAHAGYFAIPAENCMVSAPAGTDSVILLDRQEVSFQWPDGTPTGLDASGLDWDEANNRGVTAMTRCAPGFGIDPEVLGANDPPSVLLARLAIDRGVFSIGLESSGWVFSTQLGGPKAAPATLAKRVVWTVSGIPGDSLALMLQEFGGPSQAVDLKAVNGRVLIKAGNLCNNPLEWKELPIRTHIDQDDDFKWLYNLVDRAQLPDLLGGLAGYRLPVPTAVMGATGVDAVCLPGTCP